MVAKGQPGVRPSRIREDQRWHRARSGEHEFVAGVPEAAPLLIEDYIARVAEIKVLYYG